MTLRINGMKVPRNTEELLDILQETEDEDERSRLLKDFAQVVPLVVIDLLIANMEVEESKNAILTTLNLFRPDLFEEYMEKNRIILPNSLEELEDIMDSFPDNRGRVILLESLRQQRPDLFSDFFEKRRTEIKDNWT